MTQPLISPVFIFFYKKGVLIFWVTLSKGFFPSYPKFSPSSFVKKTWTGHLCFSLACLTYDPSFDFKLYFHELNLVEGSRVRDLFSCIFHFISFQASVWLSAISGGKFSPLLRKEGTAGDMSRESLINPFLISDLSSLREKSVTLLVTNHLGWQTREEKEFYPGSCSVILSSKVSDPLFSPKTTVPFLIFSLQLGPLGMSWLLHSYSIANEVFQLLNDCPSYADVTTKLPKNLLIAQIFSNWIAKISLGALWNLLLSAHLFSPLSVQNLILQWLFFPSLICSLKAYLLN